MQLVAEAEFWNQSDNDLIGIGVQQIQPLRTNLNPEEFENQIRIQVGNPGCGMGPKTAQIGKNTRKIAKNLLKIKGKINLIRNCVFWV